MENNYENNDINGTYLNKEETYDSENDKDIKESGKEDILCGQESTQTDEPKEEADGIQEKDADHIVAQLLRKL